MFRSCSFFQSAILHQLIIESAMHNCAEDAVTKPTGVFLPKQSSDEPETTTTNHCQEINALSQKPLSNQTT